MNLDALREDLKYWDDWSGDDWPLGNLSNVLAAARAVLDSDEVWWCEAHQSIGGPIWCDVNERDQDGCDACSGMVRRRLLP